MSSQRVKKGKRNIIFSFGSSMLILVLGLIVPRIVVISYGSEVNGLLSSTTQLLHYLAIFEAGLASVMRNSLYGEIAADNRKNVSGIFSAGTKYYRRVSAYYFSCLIIASVIFAFAIRSQLPRMTIFLVVMLSGMSSVITFYFLSSIKNVIEADGNYYFIAVLDLILRVLNYGVTIAAALLHFDVVVIKALALVATIINILIYRIYFKRKYGWIDKKEEPQLHRFKQRKFYIVHQLASLLFSTTDVTLLTFFANLTVVSIYTVYNSVTSAIQTLMNSISSSLVFALGQTYNEDLKKYSKLHDAIKCFYIQVNFILITICYFMFIPFVNVYMRGADADYADKWVALLFCLISLLNSCRMLDNNLASISFRMKETMNHVIIEAVINLIVSVSLIWKMGIYGVLLGTCCAILYRVAVAPYYSEKHILHRPIFNGYKHAIVNWAIFAGMYFVRDRIPIAADSYFGLVKIAFVIGIIVAAVYLLINAIFFRQEYSYFISAVFNKKLKKA
jgi:O-antigen/teichoic acid export membrane protein